ncbi:MAG: hypothetical protein IT230_12370 [Flavobacteriales bacterium]|nr:hypothetical protein [Flavobacteriales bacterium]
MENQTNDGRAAQVIPKLLHYVWVGGKEMPAGLQANIDEWQRLMPDYRIMRWDETNMDVHGHPWAQKRYAEGQFAFASDYLRLKALMEHGGFYLDVDTALKKRLDPFLGEQCLVSFEFDSFLSTGVIACRKGHPFIGEWLGLYDALEGAVISNDVITRHFLKRFPEFRLNNRDQVVGGDIRVLPKEYFAVPSFDKRKNFGINQAANSWNTKRKKNGAAKLVRLLLGDVLFFKLVNQRMSWRSEYLALDRARRQKP